MSLFMHRWKLFFSVFFFLFSVLLQAQNSSKIINPKESFAITDFTSWLQRNQNLNVAVTLKKVSESTDKLGFTHYKYIQMLNGIEIFGSDITAHSKDRKVNSITGTIVQTNAVVPANKAALTPTQIIELGKKASKGQVFMWEKDSSYFPKPQLLYIKEQLKNPAPVYVLAYVVDIYAAKPIYRANLYFDANTGRLLLEDKIIKHIDAVTNVNTAYSGLQPITASQPTLLDSFELKAGNIGNGIFTYDMHNGTDYNTAIMPKNFDNTWQYPSIRDKAILDAHFGAERTFTYYQSVHGRNSIDDQGMVIKSYVHFDQGMVNAFWDGSQMSYGDGDGVEYNPLTSLDIVGHELTHGVTEYSAKLVYSSESGALNESFSDIFGTCVEYYAKPGSFSWKLGDEINVNGDPIRDMSNPKSKGQPNTYKGENWDPMEEVHTNSGVQNYWFYLLTDGGTGTNDNNDTYTVNGLGFNKAESIAYRTLTVYLTATSNYEDTRDFSIQAAVDLFGACSPEVESVTNAWYAVGVGEEFINGVKAKFTSNKVYSCSVPAPFNFKNKSVNATTFAWDFGDGGVSTDRNPTHVYLNPGTYTVTLIADGVQNCGNGMNDTLKMVDLITTENTLILPATTCSPQPSSKSDEAGIVFFKFNTISNHSGTSEEGYEDFTCDFQTTVKEGSAVPFEVLDTASFGYFFNPNNVKIWIDLNNDGDFTSDETVYSGVKKSKHQGTIVMPAGVVYGVPLRLRVMSEMGNFSIGDACYASYSGQAEDYVVVFEENKIAPVADFTSDKIVVPKGSMVKYFNQSLNLPSSYKWNFTGGTPKTSTSKNPNIIYNTPGKYTAKLKVANTYGVDSITKTLYIEVIDAEVLCTGVSSIKESGRVVKPSETSGYGICNFSVTPGDCFQSINIMIDSLALDSNTFQSLTIYDGVDETGSVLLYYFPAIDQIKSYSDYSLLANSGSFYISYTHTGNDEGIIDISWQAVNSNIPTGTIAFSPTSIEVGEQVSFSYSNNMDTYSWDFNDGTISPLAAPTHSFTAAGTYNVSVTVTDDSGCPLTVKVPVKVDEASSSVLETHSGDVKVWPNPSNGEVSIDLGQNSKYTQVEVYSAYGEKVFMQNLASGSIAKLSLSHLSDGMYYIKLSSASEVNTVPLVLQK